MWCTGNKHVIYVTPLPERVNLNLITQKPQDKPNSSPKTTSLDYPKMSMSWTGRKGYETAPDGRKWRQTKCNPGLRNWEKDEKTLLAQLGKSEYEPNSAVTKPNFFNYDLFDCCYTECPFFFRGDRAWKNQCGKILVTGKPRWRYKRSLHSSCYFN